MSNGAGRFGRDNPTLHTASQSLQRVLVQSRVASGASLAVSGCMDVRMVCCTFIPPPPSPSDPECSQPSLPAMVVGHIALSFALAAARRMSS